MIIRRHQHARWRGCRHSIDKQAGLHAHAWSPAISFQSVIARSPHARPAAPAARLLQRQRLDQREGDGLADRGTGQAMSSRSMPMPMPPAGGMPTPRPPRSPRRCRRPPRRRPARPWPGYETLALHDRVVELGVAGGQPRSRARRGPTSPPRRPCCGGLDQRGGLDREVAHEGRLV